ncbi:MAG: bifunctional riboflavin kinase/FAD synthetase [Desulfobacca sp.]|nr:bifunctional riboflavin kinase/FAD synthetase [Desulfobacca sp.]
MCQVNIDDMLIYQELNPGHHPFRQPVITIGNFDGVHLGHQTIFQLVIERARALAGQSVVLTFDPHPLKVMRPDLRLPLLTTKDQKLRLLSTLGLDAVVVQPFTPEFAAMPARDFVNDYLCSRMNIQEVIVGHDYCFGHNREGNITLLQEMGAEKGFSVRVVDAILINHTVVSSTSIRNLVRDGHIGAANRLLGRPYEVTGVVVRGHGRGARLLNIPTANLKPDNDLLPASSIYAVYVTVGNQTYPAVANIGTCPTFQDNQLSLEVHIFDFDQDLYDHVMAVEFVARLREEKRFPGIPELVAQIQADIRQARQILIKR